MEALFSVVWVVVIIVAVAVSVGKAKNSGKTWKSTAARPAAPKPAPEVCDNPEPHRHFETVSEGGPEICDNKEPHRHFSSAAPKQVYKANTVDAPDQIRRRLNNMRDLFEAGLLTKEEYADEVRKVRRG